MTTAAIFAITPPNPSGIIARAVASRCSLPFLTSHPSPRKRCRPFGSSSSIHQTISNSNNNSRQQQNPPNAVQIPPPPSWSVNDLRLASTDDNDDKISEEELATLARRCLIDVRRLTPERRDQLRVHVGGIMRCASVLLDARNLDIGNVSESDDDGGGGSGQSDLTDEEVYDEPRGLKKIPIRRCSSLENNGDDGREDDDWTLNDSGESKAVMKSKGVQSKMIKSGDGDEVFFSVVTKR